MPNLNFELSNLIPPFPLHWTTILHYLLIIGALAMLAVSGEKASLTFAFLMGLLALLVGADLYLGFFNLSRLIIFLMRVAILVIPVITAGLGDTGQTRAFGAVLTVVALPILGLTFVSCGLPPGIGDPRIMHWC